MKDRINQSLVEKNEPKKPRKSEAKPKKKEVKKPEIKKPKPKKLKIECMESENKIKKVLSSVNFSSSGPRVFCLFCEKKFEISDDHEKSQETEAIDCMKSHLEYGYSCYDCGTYLKDDREIRDHFAKFHPTENVAKVRDHEDVRPGIQHWICDFFNNQHVMFQNAFKSKPKTLPKNRSVYVECPLCAKAKATQETVDVELVKYHDFKDFERHFNEHAKYHKYQCSICTLRVNESKFEAHMRMQHRNVATSRDHAKHFEIKRENIEKLLEEVVREKKREFEEKAKSAPIEAIDISSSEDEEESDDDDEPTKRKPSESNKDKFNKCRTS